MKADIDESANSDAEETFIVSDGIPVIDLGPAVRGERGGIESAAAAFASAFSDVGFAYVVNHGVEKHVVEDVMSRWEDLWDVLSFLKCT